MATIYTFKEIVDWGPRTIRPFGNITQKEAYEQENHRTIQYMKRYGFQNVRGGKFNYSGKYVKILGWYRPRDDFFMILGVLGMIGCAVGLLLAHDRWISG